jgi:uncharacterized protein
MRILAVTLLLALAPALWATSTQRIDIPDPVDGQFVMDHANLLDTNQSNKVQQIAADLLRRNATPIVVVTIESMRRQGGTGMSIERFATTLFNQWGIGHATVHGQSWNTGILLLVSVQDRRARIEFGAGWGRSYDQKAQEIMDTLIVPQFKRDRYGAGILAGVDALSQVAQGLEVPRPPIPVEVYFFGALFVGLAIFTAVSLYRSGSSGMAWIFWALVFSVLGMLLYSMLTRRGGSGGGFSGGGFGGGFSGGGGASGSW